MQTPEVSVVICYHTGTLIERCLTSLLTQGVPGVSREVIVVSSTPTLPLPPWYPTGWFTLLHSPAGPAEKRNLGAAVATGKYLVFLDDDVEIDSQCLYQVYRAFEDNPHIGMVFGKICKMEEGRRDEFDDCGSWLTWTGFLYARAGERTQDVGQFDAPCPILSSKSATCAIRRNTFVAVGQFDADYFILGEESDLAWRVWLSGFQVWYIPSIRSWHAFDCPTLKPKEVHYTDERIFTRGISNYLSLLCTNLGTARLATTLPLHLCAWAVAILGHALRGNVSAVRALMRGLLQFIQRLPDVQRKRRCVQSTRVITDRALMKLVKRSPPLSYYLHRLYRYVCVGLHG